MSLIKMKNISYSYPLEERKVIKDLSLTIEEGQVYGLIGANESGKTTLCNIMRGFIPELYRGKLSGELTVKGTPLADYNIGDLARIIGYSFQNPFTQLSGVKETVYEEIAYGMENLGMSRQDMILKVDELIKLFNLENLAEKNPFELSGGQKQRVGIAAILALDPDVIILDEPTSQLDPKSTEDIFKIVKLLKDKGKTVIIVEHKVDLLAEYCDTILLLNEGDLVMSGPTHKLLANPNVLSYGGQLPQVALYFIERLKQTSQENEIPLTVNEAFQLIKKGSGN